MFKISREVAVAACGINTNNPLLSAELKKREPKDSAKGYGSDTCGFREKTNILSLGPQSRDGDSLREVNTELAGPMPHLLQE